MPESVVDALIELIAQPSVNPRLAFSDDPQGGERPMTEWLGRFAAKAGWQWTIQPIEPGRANFFALIAGGNGQTILWEAHQDTVSGQGMSVAPFQAAVREGRVYGRGACDVKGSLAAMLAALCRAAGQSLEQRPNILLACSINEECGFSGARAMARLWQRQHGEQDGADGEPQVALQSRWQDLTESSCSLSLDEVRRLRPAAAIVAEPTEMNAVISHRGVVRWQCAVHGRAAHSSRPEEGANAIYAMMQVVRRIEEFHGTTLASRPAAPLCGPSTACVTTIRGGTGPNTVPDLAVIDVDRRLGPEECPEEAYRELVALLNEQSLPIGCRLEHAPPWMHSRGLSASENLAWAEQLAAVARRCGVDSRLIGVPYGTNAASIAAAGIPTVVLGPGSIAQAHTADEWIAIDQLEQAEEIYCRIACGEACLPSAVRGE